MNVDVKTIYDRSVRLAGLALREDGVTPTFSEDDAYNTELHSLANKIMELAEHVHMPKLFLVVDEKTGTKFYRVYSNEYRLAEAMTAKEAFEMAHSAFTPCGSSALV